MTPSPREIAEGRRTLVDSPGERFTGYGVMGAPFSSGHLLATRRFHATTVGPGYQSVWHRDPEGNWSIYSDAPPAVSCGRYFSSALVGTELCAVTMEWLSDSSMRVGVPGVIDWEFELVPTTRTQMMNAVGGVMPERMWRSAGVLRGMSAVAGPFLGVGKVGLVGDVPNGQWFRATPRLVWTVRTITATVNGADLGHDAPLPEQAKLGDFWIPQRGMFGVGNSWFEPLDPQRHRQPDRS